MWFALFDVTVLLVATVGIWVEKKKDKNKTDKKEGRHSRRSSFSN